MCQLALIGIKGFKGEQEERSSSSRPNESEGLEFHQFYVNRFETRASRGGMRISSDFSLWKFE